MISLGCPKNLIDSEQMLGLMQKGGYRWVQKPQKADVVIVNTCGFIDQARQESLDVIRQMAKLKSRGKIKKLVVTGCLVERDREVLFERCPDIDRLVGVFARDEIVDLVGTINGDETNTKGSCNRAVFPKSPGLLPKDDQRKRLTARHTAYLKISEGCDRVCSFCTIPSIRGKHVSKPVEQIVSEARELGASGARELVLVGQDTSYYGFDLYDGPRLAQLVSELDKVDSIDWIRLMYLYPMHITEELIDAISTSKKVLPYLDIPLQHASENILRRMKRCVTGKEVEQLLGRLREKIETLVLRSTLIVGFPGETERDFEELLEFVSRQKFERLGVFGYCREPGTAADLLDDHLDARTIDARRNMVLTSQQSIAFDFARSQVGRKLNVLIDSRVPDERNVHLGRSYADAPDVDPLVYVTGEGLAAGQIVPCEIVASQEYDLIGFAIAEPY